MCFCLGLFCSHVVRFFVLDLFSSVLRRFLYSSVLCQEIGWEERLRNDLFCVEWDIKPQLSVDMCKSAVWSGDNVVRRSANHHVPQ